MQLSETSPRRRVRRSLWRYTLSAIGLLAILVLLYLIGHLPAS